MNDHRHVDPSEWRACTSKHGKYRKRAEAALAARRLGERFAVALDYYRCGYCRLYHLTRRRR